MCEVLLLDSKAPEAAVNEPVFACRIMSKRLTPEEIEVSRGLRRLRRTVALRLFLQAFSRSLRQS